MFSKLFTRRTFVSRKLLLEIDTNICLASLKFPEGTVAGLYKQAVAANAETDIVRFDNQRLNWTLKEFDVSIELTSLT